MATGTGRPWWAPPPFPSPPSSFTANPPEEFLCPISGSLMADPVVVAADLAASASSSTPLVLVPNVALRTAILNWCDRLGLPHPAPLPPGTAHDIVRRLMPQREDQSAKLQRPQAASSVRVRRQSVDGFVLQEPSSKQRGDALEEEVMAVLGAEGATPAEQASALASLRQATRENKEVRR